MKSPAASDRTSALLRRIKFGVSRRISPKAYWYLMGRLRPVPAVTSHYESLEDCLASGAAVVALLERLHAVGPEMVTLHIGSGVGRVEYHLHRRVRKCYGVDISSSMVKRARELVPQGNAEFVESDGASLAAWNDEFFDLIYSFFVFQHMPRTQFNLYLVDAHLKLRPGGKLVFQILVDETGSSPEPPSAHPYGLRHYRRHDVEAALREAEFGQITTFDLRGDPDDARTTTGDVVFCATKGS